MMIFAFLAVPAHSTLFIKSCEHSVVLHSCFRVSGSVLAWFGTGLTSGAGCLACLWVSTSHFWLCQPTQLLSKNAVSAPVCPGSVLVHGTPCRHGVVSCWVVHASACPGSFTSISLSGGGEGQGWLRQRSGCYAILICKPASCLEHGQPLVSLSEVAGRGG